MRVQLGIERLLEDEISMLRGQRVGCVVHPASLLPDLTHTADALANQTIFQLTCLFGPQHGARGEKQDNMIESQDYRDPDTGLIVHSLYGATRRPTAEMMEKIDILLFDLQDVGTRVYTFIHTMAYCMEACAAYGKRMVILDRPNPIRGDIIEGNLLGQEYRSFVGLYPIPMRHGMTVGEMALFLNQEFKLGCEVSVIAMRGWRRSMWFDRTGLPWIMPSPNLPTLDSAIVYPGAVLIEGTTISEGRGTTRPFEMIGAPCVKPAALAGKLNALALPGVHFRPTYFEPTFNKWAGQMCGGVHIHAIDRDAMEPYLTGIAAISNIREMYPVEFQWRMPPYE